jgi:hypothetical protein
MGYDDVMAVVIERAVQCGMPGERAHADPDKVSWPKSAEERSVLEMEQPRTKIGCKGLSIRQGPLRLAVHLFYGLLLRRPA